MSQSNAKIPKAAEKIKILEKHGDVRNDPFFWLNERENSEATEHLEWENDYYELQLKKAGKLREEIFQELCSREKEQYATLPVQYGDYYYYTRFEPHQEHEIYARKRTLDGAEEIILDVNVFGKGFDYCNVISFFPSPDHRKVAFVIDKVGAYLFTVHVIDVATGNDLGELINDAGPQIAWANDNQTLFYVKKNIQTRRSQWLCRCSLKTKEHVIVFEEVDEAYQLQISKSLSGIYIFLNCDSTTSSEVRYLNAIDSEGEFSIFLPREDGHLYSLDDGGDSFFVLSNWNAKNNRLFRTPQESTPKGSWIEIIAHQNGETIEAFDVFKDHIVLTQRRLGLREFKVIKRATGDEHLISFPDPAYVVYSGSNGVFDAGCFRYEYQSLNQPQTTFDFEFESHQNVVRRVDDVPGFGSDGYQSERVWLTARDGARIPVSLVYKKGFRRDGTAGLLQTAYGSYGGTYEAFFNSALISLLDRGFVFAIVHVRGGGELGRQWYEDGKLLKKKNTFNDFIDATEFLVSAKFADPRRVFAEGRSAGGMLVGAVINMRPDLYRAVHAAVPFVDILTTMLDESLPLTTLEYEEWGNPNQKMVYDYIKSYSPYDNVESRAYPHVLVTSGFNDSQVQYWEPAKWIAKLRKYATNNPLMILKMEMRSGHGGLTGRYSHLKQRADEIAFLLMVDSNPEFAVR